MTLPGIVTGQPLDGRRVGQALFELGPCLPHEGPPGMPRVIAKQMFPQGFLPFMTAQPTQPVPPVAQPLIQPPAPANAVVTPPQTAAMPPAQPPNPAPAGYRPIREGGNPIGAISMRRRIVERKGL